MPPSTFILIPLTGSRDILEFRFPAGIETEENANWREQDTVGGVQPLFFVNVAPSSLSIQGLLLDGTETNTSITPDIQLLKDLLRQTREGAPSVLAAAWGDEQFRGVLVGLNIKRLFCDNDGNPLRAEVDLRLREIQGITRPPSTDSGQQTRTRFGIGSVPFGPQP
jgi:phage protein U